MRQRLRELAQLSNRTMVLERAGTTWRAEGSGAPGRSRGEGDAEAAGEFARTDGRLKASEDKGGFSRAVDAIRSAIKRDMLPGLFGTVAELGNVQSRYSSALEVAAGGRMQSIVAATDEDAARAIEYLKRSQIGRATFLPLNKLDRGSPSIKPNYEGIVDYAFNLVDFEPKFQGAFWYVFRDTLVVESLSHARTLMGRYRMVPGRRSGGEIRSDDRSHYRTRMKFAAEEGKKLLELSKRSPMPMHSMIH